MSEQNEDITTDLGSYSVDDEDQLQPEDTLVQEDVEDALDRGYSPPESPRGVDAFGTTAAEQAQDETIDQRILQEVPEDRAHELPRRDVASLLGMVPETFSRVLARLAKLGAIEVTRRTLVVRDAEALRGIAAGERST